MPRRGLVTPRSVMPDPKFRDVLVAKFVNVIMKHGKKGVAESIFYGACDLIKARTKQDPLQIFRKAVENAKPAVEVRSRRVGGATYQVPVEVRPSRRQALAMRWIIQSSAARSDQTERERLAAELIDAANNTGGAIRKREDVHKMAEANKAFAHYRW